MSRIRSFLLLTALSVVALPALAQDTAPDADDTLESQLDLGTPEANEPRLGERYAKEEYGDWTLACVRTENGEDPCSLLQILRDAEGAAIAEYSLFRIASGNRAVAGATIVVPLETQLTAQLRITVDDQPTKRYNYSFCNTVGCFAQIGLEQADVDAYKAGARAVLTIVPAPAPDQIVELEMSLKGFTAGFDVVDVVSN